MSGSTPARTPLRLRLITALVTVGLLASVPLSTAPATAATTVTWAGWAPLSGASNAYTTALSFSERPALSATVTTDSRSGQVGVFTGQSIWLSEGTPVGAKYGSSRNSPYLNLRPKADNAASPSVTTYSFDRPTPAAGWTFVLGDIDADAVRIRALSPSGTALTGAELGFQGGFNYCAPSVTGRPSCTGDAAEVPTWNPDTSTLTGNAAAVDTSGASAWFEPTTSIASLSIEFTRRSGFPVYQTWFAVLARDITGTVTDAVSAAPVDGATVSLIDANGDVLATTTSTDGGAYAFPGQIAADGYTVVVTPPAGKIGVVGSGTADLRVADAVVDLTVRDLIPVAVTGTVRDDTGNALPGVSVSITTDDDVLSAVTAPDGTYVFDSVPVGTWRVEVVPPAGHTIRTTPGEFTVSGEDETPVTGQDFVLAAEPSLSGTVRADGGGIPGIPVHADGPDGTVSVVTDADGGYTFPGLSPGDYTIRIEVPSGLFTDTAEQDRAVSEADVIDVDFELSRLGALSGTVRETTGTTVPGVRLALTSADTATALTSDEDGFFSAGELRPGVYTITITAPPGYEIVGRAQRTLTITAAGEAFVDQDFVLVQSADGDGDGDTPPGDGTPDEGTSGGSDPGAEDPDGLAASGGQLPLGLLAVAIGATALGSLLLRRRRRAAIR